MVAYFMIAITNKIGEMVKEILSISSKNDLTFQCGKFIELVKARNELAVSRGFKNYLAMQADSVQRISTVDWQNFLNNRRYFTDKYSPKLENIVVYPHFLSNIPKVDLSFPDDVYMLFKSTPKMKDINGQIDLIVEGNQSKYEYQSETDRYSVTIAEANHNQKIAMLIHELSHVADHENREHKIFSIYDSELGAHKIEFEVAKSISEEFLVADIREYLACFVRTEFEQIIFEDPRQAGPALFGRILAKYYGIPKDKESYLYLQDEKLIMRPFSDLSVAVAMTNLPF